VAYVMASREPAEPRVLVANDHRLFADALSSALTGHGMRVVAIVTTAGEAIAESGRSRPDLVLLDIELPDGSGIEVGKAILAVIPSTVVLAMAARAEPQTLRETIAAGFRGLVTKDASLSRFIAAAAAALAGQSVVPTDLARSMSTRPEDRHAALLRQGLTQREREVLALLVDGTSTAQMMARLGVSHNTVRTHVGRVLTKLQAHSRLEAAAFALRHGLVERHGRPA
jgi:two-component system, NarL family, nitrate/nitrite response regulator NarL